MEDWQIPTACIQSRTHQHRACLRNPTDTMSDRLTPETDKFASIRRTHQEWKIRAGNIERQREAICEMYFALLEDQVMALLQRDELMDALQRIDPFPSDEIEESWNENTVYCEITVADIRLIRASIARVKKSGA
jgi:hypothetical protein